MWLMAIHNWSKWTIFVSGGIGLLRYSSQTLGDVLVRMLVLIGGWIVRSHINGRSEDIGPYRRMDCEIAH